MLGNQADNHVHRALMSSTSFGTSITVRRGIEADAADLAELACRTFRETFAGDNRPEDLALYLVQAYGTAQQRAELANPEITTLLVEVDGQLVAYAQLRSGHVPQSVVGDSPLELWRFYVDRPWQGRGIAQVLMARVQSEAHQRGGRTLWLGVWERNERGKAFYRKVGFADVGSHVFMVGTDAQTDRILVQPVSLEVPRSAPQE